ncbi:universal stress protein [Aestuariivivens sediminis]|uniref:universal stress protein n=1 Tax=Aestuariivivens sediminis TaxID=2913557 RepID=UPI001F560B25|nr:universal stress protein [Aestuariivivens sediminis]
MKRKILLPTDFSKNAWRAIVYALELFKKDHCNFYILHAFSLQGYSIESLIAMEPGSEAYETAKLDAQNDLAKVSDMLAFKDYDNPKHHFEYLCTFGNVVEVIKNVVEEKDIDMIILGTKGKSASKTKLLGSVAIDVMEKVRNCPVLGVPETAQHHLPKEIVFPTSYKTHYKKRELQFLIDIAKTSDAAIRIIHMTTEDKLSDKQQSNKNLLEEYIQDIPHTYHILSHTNIPTATNCFVESRGSDMVAFINKKHIFFGSILTHPLVKEIGHDTKVPLLVMHDLRN